MIPPDTIIHHEPRGNRLVIPDGSRPTSDGYAVITYERVVDDLWRLVEKPEPPVDG